MRREFDAISPAPLLLNEESSSDKRSSSAAFFFLGGLVVLLILLILVFVYQKFIKPVQLKKLGKRKNSCKDAKNYLSGNLRTISYFSFQALKKATKNFHDLNLLGKGGFGPVYMGKLEDGQLVAVKKLALDKSQQGEAEFLAEVKMITSIQHKNLVRLLGCCSEGPQRLLVYEYMVNRSLDLMIYGKSDQYLDWNIRFQIILGIARGLQYLHEDSHIRIVHRDIKASNILLDDKFQPRIGDFGLARFFPEDQAYLSTTFAGTLHNIIILRVSAFPKQLDKDPLAQTMFLISPLGVAVLTCILTDSGYTAPEYAIRGELSEKADIYSFGVLVLEIISCRKNTNLNMPSEMQYLPEYAWKLYERSKMIDLVDPRMRNTGFVEKDVMQTIHVALLCLQANANTRPPMSEVVAMLTWKVEMVKSPSKPTFLDRRNRWKNEKSSWETISADFPSHLEGESPSLTTPPNSREYYASQSFSGTMPKA